jgi:hypothetical protein
MRGYKFMPNLRLVIPVNGENLELIVVLVFANSFVWKNPG